MLEAGYGGGTRQSHPVHFSQGPLLPYPRSPALFSSNGVFLFTPQPMTPRNSSMIPIGEGQNATFGNYMPQNEGYQRHSYQQTAFPFPDIGGPSGSLPGEVKTESLSSPSQVGLHKTHTIQSNGSLLTPFVPSNQVSGYENTSFPVSVNSMPLTHGQSNNNNNNSAASSENSCISSTSQSTNSLSYMARLFPGGVPQSPGFLMAHTCELHGMSCVYARMCVC